MIIDSDAALSILGRIDQERSNGSTAAQDRHEQLVEQRAEQLQVEQDARARLTLGKMPPIPQGHRGDIFLALPDTAPDYLIDQLWPSGGNVMLVAQAKAGKTTKEHNLLRSLCDRDLFLDRFEVSSDPGHVLLLDFELDERQARRWLAQQKIRNPEKFTYVNLRGQAAAFNVMTEDGRKMWAEQFSMYGARTLLLDCVTPVMLSLGLDIDRDGRRFCEAVQATAVLGGVRNSLLVHHMGHNGARPVGDSGFRNWADAEWLLTRKNDSQASPRSFSAFGRDVNFPASSLHYDEGTRRLSLAEPGTAGETETAEGWPPARRKVYAALLPDQWRSVGAIGDVIAAAEKRLPVKDRKPLKAATIRTHLGVLSQQGFTESRPEEGGHGNEWRRTS